MLEEIRKNVKEIMQTPYVARREKAEEVGIDLVMTGKVDFLLQEIDSLNEQNHELQTFKHHAEFILSEEMYEQIEEETEAHLSLEKIVE